MISKPDTIDKGQILVQAIVFLSGLGYAFKQRVYRLPHVFAFGVRPDVNVLSCADQKIFKRGGRKGGGDAPGHRTRFSRENELQSVHHEIIEIAAVGLCLAGFPIFDRKSRRNAPVNRRIDVCLADTKG